jgi:hypothetical protein
MNDQTEIENELRKLRPVQPSAQLLGRIEEQIVNPAEQSEIADNIVRPDRFRISWQSIGLGLAAAAVLVLLSRVGFQSSPNQTGNIATNRTDTEAAVSANRTDSSRGEPAAQRNRPRAPVTTPNDQFLPAGATQVVYASRDEGLMFPDDSGQPLRRFRSRTRETWQWRNPATGASLRVSYPSEQVELIPVSGQ